MMAWTTADIPDLSGLRAVITGGNSGIGHAAAAELARHGAHVTITSRDPARGAAALSELRAQVPEANIACAALDLADLASIRAFAAHRGATPLDLLINNAGIMALPKRHLTRDGFEMQFGTNHLGHFALTGLLLPVLLAAPQARVVTVSSIAHRRGEIRFDDLQLEHSYAPWRAYTQSKLANLMFALELQRRLARAGAAAVSIAAHPGVAATNLAAAGPARGGNLISAFLTGFIFNMVGQSPRRGALPILMAATAPALAGGNYVGPRGPREMCGDPGPATIGRHARDAAAAAELWHRSAILTGVDYLSD